jgi:hypothetical protein
MPTAYPVDETVPVEVRSVGPYTKHRVVARAMKRPGVAVWWAAWRMRRLVPHDATLVPVPAADGPSEANRQLARLLGRLTGASVVEALVRDRPGPSRRHQHQTGFAGDFRSAVRHQYDTLRCAVSITGLTPVVLVDNVITSGATLTAAAARLQPGHHNRAEWGGRDAAIAAVVYADART